MPVIINQNGINMGGLGITSSSSVNGILIPDETGSLVTTARADSHISALNTVNLSSGDIVVNSTTQQVGYSCFQHTGNGTTLAVNNGMDMSTQWGNAVSETYGGLVR